MTLAVEHPALLLLLPLALLSFAAPLLGVSGHPSLSAVPRDRLSRAVDALLRLAGATAISAVILGLADLHRREQTVERESTGAQIVLLIDRSGSMDMSFADRRPSGEEESKSAAARRLLADFVARRPHDRVGIVAFSTSPMPVLPLTDHHAAVQAAIAAIDRPALAFTDVGRGLLLAMATAEEGTPDASRAVVLVSDGAAVIDMRVQDALREAAKRSPFNLYWLFLRSKGSSGIFDPPAAGEPDTPQVNPERHLHLFLSSLGTSYRAFEATSPQAVGEAIAAIDKQEKQRISYLERVPRRDLAGLAYAVATGAVALLMLAKLAERRLVEARAAPRAPAATPIRRGAP